MKYLLIISLFITTNIFGNIADIPGEESIKVEGKFARNKKCVRCHLDIYKEFKRSKHHKSNILNNPSHKAMWEGNPLSKEQKYVCATCHAPAAENIDDLISGKASAKDGDKSITDGISCAMCHRIEDIHKTGKGDKYILGSEKRTYYGLRDNIEKSDYHKIKLHNPKQKNGDMCLTCHAQHKKQKQLIVNDSGRYCVFSKIDDKASKTAQNTEKENCLTCHMPRIRGSLTDRFDTDTHASHTFAALSTKIDKPERYIDLNLSKKETYFEVIINNKLPHDMILHPTRLFTLKVFINKDLVKTVEFKKEWKNENIKPFTWKKENIKYKNNIFAKSKKIIKIEKQTKPDDDIRVILGYHTFNPNLAKKINFTDKESLKNRVLIEKTFRGNK
jgi:nitrate reductase cytochrome c-type subunit